MTPETYRSRRSGRHHTSRWLHSTTLLTLILTGCEGGMVGTGSGPSEPVIYQNRSLPERISPDLPGTLIDLQALDADRQDSQENSPRNIPDDELSSSWKALNEQVTDIVLLTLHTQEMLILVDSVLPAIEAECIAAPVTLCTIPEGRLGGFYTPALMERLRQLYTTPLVGFPEGELADTQLTDYLADLETRAGTRFQFDEMQYRQLDGQPFDTEVMTRLVDVFPSQSVGVRWNNTQPVIELRVQQQVGSVTRIRNLGFNTGLPGERFTYSEERDVGSSIDRQLNAKILADGSGERRVLIETVSLSQVNGIFRDVVLNGQVDNTGGYVESREYSTVNSLPRRLTINRETFDNEGRLLAGETCSENANPGACLTSVSFEPIGPEGAALSASTLYYTLGTFETLESMQDSSPPSVIGLNDSIKTFLVLPENTALPLAERPVLCQGIQLAGNDTHLFCTAPDVLLQNVVVVTSDGNASERVIVPGAQIVSTP